MEHDIADNKYMRIALQLHVIVHHHMATRVNVRGKVVVKHLAVGLKPCAAVHEIGVEAAAVRELAAFVGDGEVGEGAGNAHPQLELHVVAPQPGAAHVQGTLFRIV